MPQGNGSPPAWRRPPAFPVEGESQLHATGSGAWWQRGSRAVVGTIQQQGAAGMRRVKRRKEEGDGTKQDGRRWQFKGERIGCTRCERTSVEPKGEQVSFSRPGLMHSRLR